MNSLEMHHFSLNEIWMSSLWIGWWLIIWTSIYWSMPHSLLSDNIFFWEEWRVVLKRLENRFHFLLQERLSSIGECIWIFGLVESWNVFIVLFWLNGRIFSNFFHLVWSFQLLTQATNHSWVINRPSSIRIMSCHVLWRIWSKSLAHIFISIKIWTVSTVSCCSIFSCNCFSSLLP